MFTIDLFEEAKRKGGKKKAAKKAPKKASSGGKHTVGKKADTKVTGAKVAANSGKGANPYVDIKPEKAKAPKKPANSKATKMALPTSPYIETRNIGRRVMRDWFALDYAAFGKLVTNKTFGEEFTNLWQATKASALAGFYESVKEVANLSSSNVVDVKEDAKKIVKKARKFAIIHLRENTEKTRSIVKEISAGVFASSDMEMAAKKATHLLIAHESIGHLFGRVDGDIRDLLRVVALRLK